MPPLAAIADPSRSQWVIPMDGINGQPKQSAATEFIELFEVKIDYFCVSSTQPPSLDH
ncbi:hypothetical protein U5801_12830 [Lamprobacter modestohalophilus]|uniref:hypothetical protein n=1 Tax=Lamprobacter modestohalophilus TaxID=1064514 RepID=UPI002ADEA9C3|nr:hypothetical protein [Lamprobacter modestohalophilus]MEA1050685.1 hypothetical protein [Lamprobacter modestohalophilus]